MADTTDIESDIATSIDNAIAIEADIATAIATEVDIVGEIVVVAIVEPRVRFPAGVSIVCLMHVSSGTIPL